MKSVETIEAEATEVASDVGTVLTQRGLTVAVAESLTGGKLANQFAATEGSGEWFAGGVVAYQSDAKHRVLGVPAGPVISKDAVVSMVEGVPCSGPRQALQPAVPEVPKGRRGRLPVRRGSLPGSQALWRQSSTTSQVSRWRSWLRPRCTPCNSCDPS